MIVAFLNSSGVEWMVNISFVFWHGRKPFAAFQIKNAVLKTIRRTIDRPNNPYWVVNLLILKPLFPGRIPPWLYWRLLSEEIHAAKKNTTTIKEMVYLYIFLSFFFLFNWLSRQTAVKTSYYTDSLRQLWELILGGKSVVTFTIRIWLTPRVAQLSLTTVSLPNHFKKISTAQETLSTPN